MSAHAFTGFICCKVISVYPGNCNRSPPLSSHQGVVLLFESRSGQLISVADAHEITALRTAAASAVATKYIVGAKKEVKGDQSGLIWLSSIWELPCHLYPFFTGRTGQAEEPTKSKSTKTRVRPPLYDDPVETLLL